MGETSMLGCRRRRIGDHDPWLCLGGWVLGSTAERMAKERVCVERFMGQADAAMKLAAFQKSGSWQQSQFLEKGGWATATGSNAPNSAVANACAQELAKIKT